MFSSDEEDYADPDIGPDSDDNDQEQAGQLAAFDDDSDEEDFNFQAIRDRDIVVSPIQEVTEPPTEVSTPAITPVPEPIIDIDQTNELEIEPKIEPQIENSQMEPGDEDVPLPKRGAYEFDFDKFDDPNFNPFETKTKVVNAFDQPNPAVTEIDHESMLEGEPGDDFDDFQNEGNVFTRATILKVIPHKLFL